MKLIVAYIQPEKLTAVKRALYDKKLNKIVLNYVYGLGGREIKLEDIEAVANDLVAAVAGKEKDTVTYLGVRA